MKEFRTIAFVAGLAGGFLLAGSASAGQPAFAAPEAALEAFRVALAAPDGSALLELLGDEHRDELIGADPASARQTMAAVRNAAAEAIALAPGDAPGTFDVLLGRAGWPMPIPLVQTAEGWVFDTEAGLEEIIDRRIGENELAAIAAARAYVEAQLLYGSVDRNGDGVPEFAQRLVSTPGEHDGLFWPTAAGEEPSPLAPLASSEADYLAYRESGEPYYGYRFKVLTAQTGNALGGAYEYLINGRMLAGFGLLAWPADYGNSGIMSFIVNQLGDVYEADLGEGTDAVAEAITAFDPAADWALVED
ncbi:MAG TPA: DUF2950 family protein [Geminicoccaceae bacterium]|jgi:hypothetical protein|nr:DUF2950 family protein [Geminicoccaceae bacterium]HRY25896.1 DUF2950 family protein [Geminicoccaceae bacterium]